MGKIEKIIPRTRNDAHRLIEECMLAANVCAADLLIRHEQPAPSASTRCRPRKS
jgi:ribonuclease R